MQEMNFEEWSEAVLEGTCFDFRVADLWQMYNDGDSVQEAIEYAEDCLDEGLFG